MKDLKEIENYARSIIRVNALGEKCAVPLLYGLAEAALLGIEALKEDIEEFIEFGKEYADKISGQTEDDDDDFVGLQFQSMNIREMQKHETANFIFKAMIEGGINPMRAAKECWDVADEYLKAGGL